VSSLYHYCWAIDARNLLQDGGASMNTKEFLLRLNGVKITGSGWISYCPSHNDQHHSLSICESSDGKLLVYCHAGCSFNDILAAVGTVYQSNESKKSKVNGKWTIIATYDYYDEKGSVLYQVVKTEPKGFFQRRPDGAGGWIKDLKNVRKVLYRLPELIEADPALPVFIVEGEKDAETLASNGLVTTTNSGGCNSPWVDDYTNTLKDRHIVLIPDHDEPGVNRVKELALILKNHVASLRIVDVHDGEPLPKKHGKDITDWFNAGGTVDQLLKLVEETSHWDANNEVMPLICNFKDFKKLKLNKGEKIAFELCRREVGMLSSITNRGKSTLIRNVLLTLATGGKFDPLVEQNKQRRVLLLDFETSSQRLQSDLLIQTQYFTEEEIELVDNNLFIVCEGMIGDELLNLSHHMKQLEKWLESIKPIDFVVIDTQSAAFDLFNENDNAEVGRKIIKPLLRLARIFDCAVLVSHHIGKQKSEEGQNAEKAYKSRGASSFGCGATTVFNLTADPASPERVTLTCAKRKNGSEYERLMILDQHTRWFSLSEEIPTKPATNTDLILEFINSSGRSRIKTSEVENYFEGKMSDRTVRASLKRLLELGELFQPCVGWWSLAKAENTEDTYSDFRTFRLPEEIV
jgi:putative DNA primase/helicase